MTGRASLRIGAIVAIATAASGFAALSMTGAAKADTFDFTYSNANISAMGTLTATEQSSGQYKITAISGKRNGIPITALIAPNGYAFGGQSETNDNILYYPAKTMGNFTGQSYLDAYGFAYTAGGRLL